MDNEDNVERHFSLEDLRKLFELNEETDSDTHDRSAMGGRCHLGGGDIQAGTTTHRTSIIHSDRGQGSTHTLYAIS